MVKFLIWFVWETFDKKLLCIYLVEFSLEVLFPIKLLCNIDESNSYILFQNNRIVLMIFLNPDYLHICI